MFGVFRPNPALSGIIFLATIFIEIASIIIVGRAIGVLATLALLLLGIIVGFSLLRIQSANFMAKMQNSFATGQMQSGMMADNAMMMFAAILFIIPGFVSDIIAILLLFPPVRALIGKIFYKRFSFNTQEKSASSRTNDQTIDLNAEDYHSIDPDASPWKKEGNNRLPPKKD